MKIFGALVRNIPKPCGRSRASRSRRSAPDAGRCRSGGFNGRFANKLLVQLDAAQRLPPTFSGVFWEEHRTGHGRHQAHRGGRVAERCAVVRTQWNGVINIRDPQGRIDSRHDGIGQRRRPRPARRWRRATAFRWRTTSMRGSTPAASTFLPPGILPEIPCGTGSVAGTRFSASIVRASAAKAGAYRAGLRPAEPRA